MVLTAKPCATNAVAEIVDWCRDLPVWQQDALRRIVEKCDLTPADMGELATLCMHSHGIDVETCPNVGRWIKNLFPRALRPARPLRFARSPNPRTSMRSIPPRSCDSVTRSHRRLWVQWLGEEWLRANLASRLPFTEHRLTDLAPRIAG